MKRYKNISLRLGALILCGAFLMSVFTAFPAHKKAEAFHCGSPVPCCIIIFAFHNDTRTMVAQWHQWLRFTVFGTAGTEFTTGTARLGEHEEFLLEEIFFDRLLPAMMMMTEQFVSMMMMQTAIIGGFFDAKQQLETQALFQELTARAHKDYHPSFGMCVFGTNMRSVAAAERNAEFSQMVLNERFLDRQLGNHSSVGAGSPDEDRISSARAPVPTPYNRLGYFLQNTCDRNDLNKEPTRPATGLFLCRTTLNTGWMNRDIDFFNTVMGPRNIDLDFKDDEAADNSRILEMTNYLYGHDLDVRMEDSLLERQRNQDDYLRDRSVTAKRSVAQNSFNALVGLKSRGTRDSDIPGARNFSSEGTSEYMHFILQELGIADTSPEYYEYLSHKDPAFDTPSASDTDRNEMSYYAQMEVLAKRIYQRPEFYTNLYDKPANVKRKSAALQAIAMMLERDIYDSYLRSEAMLSMILELRVIEEQGKVENVIRKLTENVK